MYSTIYAEVLKNQQTAEFMLDSQTPYFQLIDVPFLPLGNVNKFKLLGVIIPFVVSIFVFSLLTVLLGYYIQEIKPILSETN